MSERERERDHQNSNMCFSFLFNNYQILLFVFHLRSSHYLPFGQTQMYCMTRMNRTQHFDFTQVPKPLHNEPYLRIEIHRV